MNSVPEDILKFIVKFCDNKSTTKLALTSKDNYNKLWDLVGTYTCEFDDSKPEIILDEIEDDFVVETKKPQTKKCRTCNFLTSNLCEECTAEVRHAMFLMSIRQDEYDDRIEEYRLNND